MVKPIQLENCAFCVDQPNYKGGIDQRVIIETENFRVFPTMGQIVPGYSLIAPKEHVITYGAIPETLFGELTYLKKVIYERTSIEFEKPIFLEHGGIGQTITHAHIHSIPMPEGKDWNVLEYYKKDLPHESIQGVWDLPKIWKNKGHYLYLEMQSGSSFAFYTPIVPMYGRIAVAEVLGIPERADWKKMDRTLDEQLMAETLKKLRK